MGSQRHLFDVPDDVAYFNTANMSPLLTSVREAGEAALARRGAPWRISSADWFTDVELLRAAFADLLGTDPDSIALVPATSYGLAIAARNLTAAPGDRVILLADEYPSNYYTWQRFCRRTGAELAIVGREPGQSWAEAITSAIDDRAHIVSVPNVHWTNGGLVDLDAVAPAARSVGATLVIDASQSLGAMPLDIARLQPDFVVTVGYKWLLGPFGVGFLYVSERCRGGVPLEENWINREGSDDFAALVQYSDGYRPGARRFDVGQRTNFGLVPMSLAAFKQLRRWTVAGVGESLRVVTSTIRERAQALGFTTPPNLERGPHMLGLDVPQEQAIALADRLAAQGVVASVRGTSMRIAPHLHTTQSDVDRLLAALGYV